MEKKNRFNLTLTSLPLKINLCYESTINTSTEIYTNDPIYKLLDNSDIENILKLKDGPITKFFYFNKKCVHKILYETNQNIRLDYDENNNNLSFYFYLLLLMDDTPEILNYIYDKKYIIKLNKEQEFNNEPFKKIITSKIIIQLANEFKYINDYHNDKNEDNIKKITNSNLKTIEDLIKELDIKINWSKEEVCSKKIDELYIEIINALIIGKKFENYDYIYYVIKQLDLEKINLTKTMLDGLLKILNDEKYMKEYIIANKLELFNTKKINFNYILIRYILTNPIYIYQIPFLFKLKKNINKIIKKIKTISIEEKNSVHKRLKYIVTKLVGPNKCIEKKKGKIKDIILRYLSNPNLGEYNKDNFAVRRKTSNKSLNSDVCLQNIEIYSFLHIIKFAYELTSDEVVRDSLVKHVFIDENIEQKLKKKKYSKKEEDKVKEIITNVIFKQLIENDKDSNENTLTFNKYIKEVFYFEVYEEIKPQNVNEKSINIFKNWIKENKNIEPD